MIFRFSVHLHWWWWRVGLSWKGIVMSRVKEGDVLDGMDLYVVGKFEFIGLGRDNPRDWKRLDTLMVQLLTWATGDNIFNVESDFIVDFNS